MDYRTGPQTAVSDLSGGAVGNGLVTSDDGAVSGRPYRPREIFTAQILCLKLRLEASTLLVNGIVRERVLGL
jgi:hypothetical protein